MKYAQQKPPIGLGEWNPKPISPPFETEERAVWHGNWKGVRGGGRDRTWLDMLLALSQGTVVPSLMFACVRQ